MGSYFGLIKDLVMFQLTLDDKIAMLFKAVKTFSELTVKDRNIYHYHGALLAFEELQFIVIQATFQRYPLVSCAHALLEIADNYVFEATNAYYTLN